MTVMFLIPYLIWGIDLDEPNIATGEVVGYISMILSLLVIFFGIKTYRDKELNGVINYWQGLKAGLAIDFIASLMFGVYSYILLKFIMPEFVQEYYQFQIDKIKNSGKAQEQIASEIAHMEIYMTHHIYSTMEFQSFIMFATVFIIGLIIAIFSAAILYKRTLSSQ